MNGAKVKFLLASITGSFKAYKYTVELNRSISLYHHLLNQISASILVSYHVESAVLTVTKENRSLARTDHYGAVCAFVDLHLRS